MEFGSACATTGVCQHPVYATQSHPQTHQVWAGVPQVRIRYIAFHSRWAHVGHAVSIWLYSSHSLPACRSHGDSNSCHAACEYYCLRDLRREAQLPGVPTRTNSSIREWQRSRTWAVSVANCRSQRRGAPGVSKTAQ